MNIRQIVFQDNIHAQSKFEITRKVSSSMALATQQCNENHAKVRFDTSAVRPYGPFGNCYQTLTVEIEGDYDDPVYKAFYDEKSAVVSRVSNSQSGGCYVATAVYGSYDCPQVWTLRRFRDYTLAETWYGRAFIRTYYAISPTLVKLFGKTTWFKKLWKGKLDRMVANLNAAGVENSPYKDKNIVKKADTNIDLLR